MKKITRCSHVLLALLIFNLSRLSADASTPLQMSLSQTARGNYASTGAHNGDNYFVGQYAFQQYTFRNYFVFDLSQVTQPISSATLALYNIEFNSYAVSENYELRDISMPISDLLAGTDGIAAFNDLGSGLVYGNRLISATDNNNIVDVKLNATVISAMNSSHGLFGFGGWFTGLLGSTVGQWAFGYSYTGGLTELRLTFVPEPSTIALTVATLATLPFHRRRPTSHNRS